MQQYLREELERLAHKPSLDDWLERVRVRKALAPREISSQTVLDHRDADRG
jgi:hypothetical protein